MELLKDRKKVIYGFGIFLIFMFVCYLIAKGIYSSGLPQVDTVLPMSQSIIHEVKVTGLVVQGKEDALHVMSGLRVKDILVRYGQKVTPEDPLFEVDLEDLEKQITVRKREIQRLNLQMDDLKKNEEASRQQKIATRKSANDAYKKMVKEAEEKRKEAQKKYKVAVNDLKEFRNTFEFVMDKIETAETKEEYVALALKKQQLEEALESAKTEHENAITAKENRLLSASRTLENAKKSDTMNSSVELQELELIELINTHKEYSKLLEAEGKILSTMRGTVSACNVQVGGITSDYSAVNIIVPNGPIVRPIKANEIALPVMSGLRVKRIFVAVDDYVEEGDVLFEVDVDDLKEKIRLQELSIHKLKMQMEDAKKTSNSNEKENARNVERAEEDYKRAEVESNKEIELADKKYKSAKKELENFNTKYASVMKHIEAATLGKEYQGLIQKLEQLQEQVDRTKELKESAKDAKDTAIKNGKKLLEDANSSVATNSLKIMQMDREEKLEVLEEYEKILDQKGIFYSPKEGTVIEKNICVGDRTTDGTAIKVAQEDQIYEFHTTLEKEQLKYVKEGDLATLTFSGKAHMLEVTIDYIVENKEQKDIYDVTVVLPEGKGAIGEAGELYVKSQSPHYSLCIPSDVIIGDDNIKSVYIVSQKESILGTELAARAVPITVIDSNENYSAIEEGLIDSSTEIIIDSTKTLTDGVAIRYKEW